MFKSAAVAVPIAAVIESALEARTDPVRAGIWNTGPVTFVPAVMPAYGIPVAFNPDKIRARRRWCNNHSRRRWRTNPDANTNLGAEDHFSAQNKKGGADLVCTAHRLRM